MKIFSLAVILAATVAATALAKEASPFANFDGNFSKHGRVEITGGDGLVAEGRMTPRFSIGKSGKNGRLKIRGEITLNGATRALNVTYLFRPVTEEGIREAALSNLAPGIDDGFSAEEGSYTVFPRTIRAEVPFVVGTTKGAVTLFLRLKERTHSTELTVTHVLSSNTLTRPITWTFRGRMHR